jgi:hypothetical protein
MKQIFKQEYSGESLCDVDRDVSEAIDSDFNPVMKEIPVDKHYFQEGTFTVTITWEPDNG